MRYKKGKTLRKNMSVSLPAPPRWIEVKMAVVPGSSQCVLVYDARVLDAVNQGPVGLATSVCIRGTPTSWTSLLDPPTAEHVHVGMMAVRETGGNAEEIGRPFIATKEGLVPASGGLLVEASWVYALEWRRGQKAWDTLLTSLDSLSTPNFVLPAEYLLLTIFVARLAHLPTRLENVNWGHLLQEAQEVLLPMFYALRWEWLGGPSSRAALYRECHELAIGDVRRHLDDARHQRFIASIERVVGAGRVDSLRCAMCYEAAVLRVVDETCQVLWTSPHQLFDAKQRKESMRYFPAISALLPLALWHPDGPAIDEGVIGTTPSLMDIYRIWRTRCGSLPGKDL